jgi:hypothetical protein
MECPDFLAAFQKAHGLLGEHEITRLEYQSALDLIVTSGRIIACDPYYCGEEKPFKECIPLGRYPVILCVAHFQNGDQRVALAALRISESSPVRWEIATRPGEDEASRHGYCVDSATGCFMDADAAFWAAERTQNEETFFEDQMTYLPTWGWVNVSLDSLSAANVVAFSSGWGDGSYPTFFGYDATGQPACLITDFGVLQEA